jgi:hypothetical protein
MAAPVIVPASVAIAVMTVSCIFYPLLWSRR